MAGKKPYTVVTLVQVIYAGMFLLLKAAFDGSLNNFVFIFYRQTAAAAFLVPLALYFEWRTWPSLSFPTCCKICLASLFGIAASLDTYGLALLCTSPTLAAAAAAAKCLPAITLFVAVLLRKYTAGVEEDPKRYKTTSMAYTWRGMEALPLRIASGLSKLEGIVVCLGGAATLALYEGPQIKLRHLHRCHNNSPSHPSSGTSWVKGCFLMLLANFCWSFWLVSQGWITTSYPSRLMLTLLQCFMSSIQTFIVALSLVRDPSEWKLGWNIRLLAVAYCGIVVTGMAFYLQTWVIEKRGPVSLAMSTPRALIITVLVSSFLLCDSLTFGSILGGVLLVGGLYSVLWGKSREKGQDQGSRQPVVDQECSVIQEETSSHADIPI